MHAVTGFIQILLMLTQASFVPDMQGFWEQLDKPPVTKPCIFADTVTKPGNTAAFYQGFLFVVPVNRDAEPSPAAESKLQLYRSPINTFPSGRVIAAQKLYLIFCQLRIGG